MTSTGNGEQLSKHIGEFQKKASEIGHNVKDIGKISGEIAADTTHIAEKRMSETYNAAAKKARILEENFETGIRKNPVRSLMIAAGVGLVLGAMWRRR